MSTREFSERFEGDDSDQRYREEVVAGGEVLIYDRENPDAWIQSSYAVEVGADE